MQHWNDIMNVALLGTSKRAPDVQQLHNELAEAAALIQGHSPDKEEQFLQLAAVLFNYRQCGTTPLHKENVAFNEAGPEEKQYCSAFASRVLRNILDADSLQLLRLWLEQSASKRNIVPPDLIPELFNIAVHHKKLQNLVVSCCGKRGEWLSRFNKEWNFSTSDSPQQLWETGTLEQRKDVLLQLRQQDPSQAREWLQKTWPQEDAATKAEFLQLLHAHIGEADIAFLEGLSNEKGKKVKELALKLLKQIPASSIVQQYREVLEKSVLLKKEKSLLGLSRQTSLQVKLPDGIDHIFKTGIDKLSSTKELSDEEHIIYQLIQAVPPTFWESHLENSPGNIILMFQKDRSAKKLLPALISAAVNFDVQSWAIAFMQNSEIFYLDILPLLPIKQQEHYSLKFIDKHPDDIIYYASKRKDEWSLELTAAILKHMAKNIYRYNSTFYEQHIHLLPLGIAPVLEKAAPAEEYLKNTWKNTSEHILKLVSLKEQTLKAFNA